MEILRNFSLDHRNRDRQRYCSAAPCRLASKTASQAAWLCKPQNTDYFRSPVHVQRVQVWRMEHIGYSAGKPARAPGSKPLQDGLIAQVHDSTEEIAKRTELAGLTVVRLVRGSWAKAELR